MDDEKRAVEAAREHVRSYQWIPQETEHAFSIHPEQLLRLCEDEARLYRMQPVRLLFHIHTAFLWILFFPRFDAV